jgi:3-dehydrosphinganine reductase
MMHGGVMKDFSNKLVYITGGSSGIGLETARQLSSMGANVAIFARTKDKLDQARNDIERHRRSSDQKIYVMQVDVADNDDVQEKMKEAIKIFGGPDIVITSAGVGQADLFENISHQAFDTLMKINVYGTRSVIAALLPSMKERGGHIVIISSAAGLMGMFGYTSYSASKYALVGFAECLRGEIRRYGIAVTLVCPPEVDTPFLINEAGIPPEARALKNFAGTLKPAPVARTIVKGIGKKKFLVVPGLLAKLLFLNHRLTNGLATRLSSDIIVRLVRMMRRPGQDCLH